MEPTRTIKRIAVIGAGGVASYLLPVLIKALPNTILELWDKDILEERNLDRQLFSPVMIGQNKAQALLATLEVEEIYGSVPQYFTTSSELHEDTELIICVADNHRARKAALIHADIRDIPVIIGANEYFDSEAYIYYPEWNNSPRDPRIRYPEILTDKTGDPTGCQGTAVVEAHPQLPVANMSAAAKIAQLLWAWEMTTENSEYLPYEISTNVYGTTSIK